MAHLCLHDHLGTREVSEIPSKERSTEGLGPLTDTRTEPRCREVRDEDTGVMVKETDTM